MCACTHAHSCVQIVFFLLFSTQCSFLITHNLAFMLFILLTLLIPNLKLLFFMPKYLGYRTQVDLLPNILSSSLLTSYHSTIYINFYAMTKITYMLFENSSKFEIYLSPCSQSMTIDFYKSCLSKRLIFP